MKKILLAHLNSNGDCLFATVIARQIKEIDFPDCHLTWAVNSRCKQTVLLNPFVDVIWEIPTAAALTTQEEWNAFVAEAEKKRKAGEFDQIFYTQIIGRNLMKYDGGIRSSVYNCYPNKIKVPHQPVIRLSDDEVENVRRFAARHELEKYRHVVLVECAPASFDAALNPQTARELAREFVLNDQTITFILSSNKPFDSDHPQIIDGSVLSFRENAELTKHCNLFVGCGSGISWLTTSDWAKKLPMILVINEGNFVNPSVRHDHGYFNLPTDHIIEIGSRRDSLAKLNKCLRQVLDGDFSGARQVFGENLKTRNYEYLQEQLTVSVLERKPGDFFSCLIKSVRRNGIELLFTPQFRRIPRHLYKIIIEKSLKKMRLKNETSI